MSWIWIKKHWAFFPPAAALLFAYRLNHFTWWVRSIFVFLATAWLWLAVYGTKSSGGYDSSSILFYVIVAAMIGDFVVQDNQESVAEEIVSGRLNGYLVQPISHFWSHFVISLPPRLFVLAAAPVKLLVFVALFSQARFAAPQDPARWLFFAASLALAVLLFCVLDYLTGILAFWFYRAAGVRWAVNLLWVFGSGAYIPLGLLPNWLGRALLFTPFPSLIYAPVAQLVGPESFDTRLLLILEQGVWIAVLFGLVRLFYKAGIKRYEAVGI